MRRAPHTLQAWNAPSRFLAYGAALLCLAHATPLDTGKRVYTLGGAAPAELEAKAAEQSGLSLRFVWSLSEPTNYLRVLGGGELPASMPDPAVHLYAEGEQITAEIDAARARTSVQVGASKPSFDLHSRQAPQWKAELLRAFERRQPNGQKHMIRHVLLSCEWSDEHGAPLIILQQFEVDLTLGSVDAMPCSPPPRWAHLPAKDYHSMQPGRLPEKINGSPIRREMLRLLYALAAIDSPVMAAQAAPQITAFAWRLAAKAPAPHAPWPRCWDAETEDAQEIARRITPTLVYLQQNECFECSELAAFINSPTFSRIFGERFTHMPGEPVQEEPISYQKKE